MGKKIIIAMIVLVLLQGCSTGKKEVINEVVAIESNSLVVSEQSTDEITPSKATWAGNTLIDTDLPELDYADEDKIIFHAYFGLFIYDLKHEEIVNSLDLKQLGCQKVQGGCNIHVSNDGDTIWIKPNNEDYVYCFLWKKNLLTQSTDEENEKFSNFASKWDVMEEELGNTIRLCSNHVVLFEDGTVGYIVMKDAQISTMVYCKGSQKWELFTKESSSESFLLKQDDSYYEAYRIYAQKSLDNFLYTYSTFYNVGDYAGICALSKGIDYSDEEQQAWKEADIKLIQMEQISDEQEIKKTIKCIFQLEDEREELYLELEKIENEWYANGLPQ